MKIPSDNGLYLSFVSTHTKFGMKLEDIAYQMDRRVDGGDNNIPFAFLKKRGDNDIYFKSFDQNGNHAYMVKLNTFK